MDSGPGPSDAVGDTPVVGPGRTTGDQGLHLMEPVGWIWMLIWIAALLMAVWLIVRTPRHEHPTEDAMAILRARFARGDISQEEYERAREALLIEQGERTR